MSQPRNAAARKPAQWGALWALTSFLFGCAGFEAAQLYRDGTLDLNAGRHEAAVVRLTEASRLSPDSAEIHNHLGLALAAVGRHRAALDSFERAVELDCDNTAAATNLEAARIRAARDLGAAR